VKLSSVVAVGLAGLSVAASADQTNTSSSGKVLNPWLIRLRALDMVPANQSRAFSALGLNFPNNAVSLSTKVFPEVDVSYFFTPNIVAELVLTYPQQHNVSLQGVGHIGTVTHLPPTLMLQYHYPIPNSPVTPYAGIGVNYTMITAANLSAGGTALNVTRNSVGFAYGAGVDIALDKNWSLNFDFKHVYIGTNVKVKTSGAILTNLDVNPNLFSVGIGYRF
jgi:outer membrane protein